MFGAAKLTDDLVAAAADGAALARAQVSEALCPQVWMMVMGRLSPTLAQWGAVEDLSQQVLLALAEGLGRLEQRTVGGLKAFLSGIVDHKVGDFLRSDANRDAHRPAVRSLESTVEFLSRAGPLHEFLSSSGTSPLSAVERAERLERLMAEFRRLKDAYRQVITLALFDQLPTAEIARRMQRSPRAASMLFIRATKALRRKIGLPPSPPENDGQDDR